MADLSQPLPRAVPETREDGAVVASCRDGQFTAKPVGHPRVGRHEAEIGIEQDGGRVLITAGETELRTCIAALTAVLGQLDPDHPAAAEAA